MTKSDLFIGCLGNGITVCDKSREEYGDYKHIAHIRESESHKVLLDLGYQMEYNINAEIYQKEKHYGSCT